MRKLRRVINCLNVPKIVCTNLLGERHKPVHRISIGAIVMLIGVYFSKCFTGYSVHFIFETIGYLFHGIGCVPIVEQLGKLANDSESECKKIGEDIRKDVDKAA